MREISVLVVDDEPHARDGLAELIRRQSGFQLSGVAADGAAAVRSIVETRPDVVLLDVQMPRMNGFDVISEVGPERMPYVIFVTAHDAFALQAFDHSALDYVLKPFKDARLVAALERARRALADRHYGDIGHRLLRVLSELGVGSGAPEGDDAGPARLDRFVVRVGNRAVVLPVADVDWIEAANYCVRLHTGNKVYAVRHSMTELETRLDAAEWIRLHRSILARRTRIRELKRNSSGDHSAVLDDGTLLPVGRNRWAEVLDSCRR